MEKFAVLLKEELAIAEPNLLFTLQPIEKPENVFDDVCTQKVINLLNVLPNGVIRNSDVVEGVVETSLSIGVLRTENNRVEGTKLIRTLIASGTEYVEGLLDSLTALSGAELEFSNNYPGW